MIGPFSNLARLIKPWALPLLAVLLLLGAAGFIASEGDDWSSHAAWTDGLYRSLQMFGLNFELDTEKAARPGPLLDIVRFVIAFIVFVGALALLGRPLFKNLWLFRQRLSRKYVVVLGYGPVGQAIARAAVLSGERVVAVDLRPGRELYDCAAADGVLLISGDASRADYLEETVDVGRARKVHVSLSTDMATLDAAGTVKGIPELGRGIFPSPRPRSIRAFYNDPELVLRLPEAGEAGLSSTRDVFAWSVAQLAAEDFCAEANLGRLALELGQARVHLVLFGCGAQGTAILRETLATGWRVGLAPPAVTVFDHSDADIERRIRRVAPALFAEADRSAVPQASRPELSFLSCDLEHFDFATDTALRATLARHPATAFVVATGSDTLNLTAALALEQAILREALDPAPVFTRIWNVHQGKPAHAGFDSLGSVRQFGALERTIGKSLALKDEPDAMAIELNGHYDATSQYFFEDGKKKQEGTGSALPIERWKALSATKKAANRRHSSHVPAKLEDIGLQWRGPATPLPHLDQDFVTRFRIAEDALDYRKIERDKPLSDRWFRDGIASARTLDRELAEKIKDIAIVEHDRWMTERALDGWLSAGVFDENLRRNHRKIHHCMVDWAEMKGSDEKPMLPRRYDAALLRGVIERRGGSAPVGEMGGAEKIAWPRHVVRLALQPTDRKTVPDSWLVASATGDGIAPVTEIRLRLLNPASATQPPGAGSLAEIFHRWRADVDAGPSLCRVVIEFTAAEQMALTSSLQPLAETLIAEGIEVSTLFDWRAKGGKLVG